MKSIFTVRHAVFLLPGYRLVSDLYHPPSKSVYEVKTRYTATEPDFRPRIRIYRMLIEEKLVKQVVFLQVSLAGSKPLSFVQWREIKEAGFKFICITP
jgi:hypothetical protein